MARLHGRGPRGERARGAVPLGPWTRLSVLGALGREGMLAAMSVEGATSGAVFHAYLERVLLPALRERKPDAGPCREFRVRSGMLGAKEPRHATTQRAEDTRRHSRPAAGRRRSEDGLRPERPARRAEEGARRTGVKRRDGPSPRR